MQRDLRCHGGIVRTFSRIDSSTGPGCEEGICRALRDAVGNASGSEERFPNDKIALRRGSMAAVSSEETGACDRSRPDPSAAPEITVAVACCLRNAIQVTQRRARWKRRKRRSDYSRECCPTEQSAM